VRGSFKLVICVANFLFRFPSFGVNVEMDECCIQVLVGESLVKQANPSEAIAGLFGKDISRKGVGQ
jgi:hypothetical protein